MGQHSPVHAPNPWRTALAAGLALVTVATIVSLAFFWPHSKASDHVSSDFAATFAANQPQVKGEVTQLDDAPSGIHATIDLESGEQTQLDFSHVAGEPNLKQGDKIVLYDGTNPDGSKTYAFADYQRETPLLTWVIVAVIAIACFAVWHGLRSLVGLAFSLAVVFGFLLPALSEGSNPLALAIVACAAILLVAIPLVHGLNWKSAAALGGSLLSLGLAGVFAWASIHQTQLQGMSSDDNLKLLLYLPGVSVVGVLLCGFVIGSLGGLNDVTIGQASTVNELAELDPTASPRQLFLSAMKVGRDHIASMVYTVVLTYTGAALPILMLISAANRPLGQILTSDLVATELLRSIVGMLALTMAVPLTTLIAAVTVPER